MHCTKSLNQHEKHMKNTQWIINTFVFLFLLSIVFLIYSSNLNGPFIFDDSRIQNNPQIHITSLSPQNLLRAGFESSPQTRPAANISFALNYYFHGFDTMGYHLVNIAIHALAAFFLYLFIQTTLNLPLHQATYAKSTLLPLAAALLWAVHPLQTQSVTYIIQRMNSIAAMFYILSLLLYAKARIAGGRWTKILLFPGAALAGLLAFGSKETAATLPFFVFLYEWYFFQDLDFRWLKKQIVPVFLLLACSVAIIVLYLGANPLEQILATYSGRDFTLSQRVLTEFRVVIFYISLLLFPHPARLNLDHHFSLSTGLFSPVSTIISVAIILLLFVAALFSAKKYRLISFCLLWFLGNLVIESSVIGLELIFEHRNYLPSMLLILLALIISLPILKQQWLKIAFLSFIVLLFSYWTFERNRVWNDRVSLWGDSAAKSPAKARPHNNLGVALKDHGRLDEAVAQFQKTILLEPKFAEAYNNLGNTYLLQGKQNEAITNFKMSLNISPDSPNVHVNLGNALVKRWELEEALLHYGEALRLQPDNEEARLNFFSTKRMLDARKLKSRNTKK